MNGENLMDFFDAVTPDFIEEGLSDWRRTNYLQLQRYEERIHENTYGADFNKQRVKDGVNDNNLFVDMTTIHAKSRFEKDNFVPINDSFGVNAAFETNVGVGWYRGDKTGKKDGESHDFGSLSIPTAYLGVGAEATLAYNGNDKFKPEIGLSGELGTHGRINTQVDAVAKISSQITEEDRIYAQYKHTLHKGGLYPMDIESAGIQKGYLTWGNGNEVSVGYEHKMSDSSKVRLEAFYQKLEAGPMKNNSFEPDTNVAGLRVGFTY